MQRPAIQTFQREIDGTPIIMQGYGSRRIMREEVEAPPGARPIIPRGSSTYIPPLVPSPVGPSVPSLLQPPPAPYQAPRINSSATASPTASIPRR